MKIDYTPQFKEALDNMFTCNKKFYSNSVLQKVMESLRHYRNLLADNPLMGPKEPLLENLSTEYRSIIIQKGLRLIYFIYNDIQYFADLWDTRQSEEHLRQRIIGSAGGSAGTVTVDL